MLWKVLATVLIGIGFVEVCRSAAPSRTGDGGLAIKATIDGPSHLAFDSEGNLFVYESSDDIPPSLRVISAKTGRISTVAVGCEVTWPPKDQPGCLSSITDLRVVGENRLQVTEFLDNRIRRLDLDSKMFSLVAGNGEFKFSGDGGPAIAAGIMDPQCATIDQAGNLFVCDSTNRIRRIDATTGIITTVAGPGLARQIPLSLAVDGAGNLFAADEEAFGDGGSTCHIRKIDAKTGVVATIAGSGRKGRPGLVEFEAKDGPALNADLGSVRELVFDKKGNILFLNNSNHVFRMNLTTGMLTTVAGRNRRGYDGDGGPATQAHIDAWGMALDPKGNLFLADWKHNRIRRVDAVTGIITTFAGNGRPHRKPSFPIL